MHKDDYLHNAYDLEIIHDEQTNNNKINMNTPTISKVKACQGAGNFTNDFGTFNSFQYEMEDGTILKANHKNEPFKIGDEIEYTVKREHPEHGKSGSVGKPQPPVPGTPVQSNSNSSTQTFKQDPAKARSIEMQVCLKEANQYHSIHGFSNTDTPNQQQVCDTAKMFYNVFN